MGSSTVPVFGNIFAPEWMGWSRILPNIRDVERDIDLPSTTVPTGGTVRNLQLPIDTDGDYLVREIQFVIFADNIQIAPDAVRVRIRDGRGKLITTDFVPVLDMNGPIVPPLPLCAGEVLYVDFQNVGVNDCQVWMTLKGWMRTTCTAPGFEPKYVPMYRRYSVPQTADPDDFEYPFTFTSSGAGDFLRQPLQTDNDADFLWRGLTGDWNTDNNDVPVVGQVALTFYAPDQVPLSQTELANPWGSTQAGEARELILPSGGGRVFPIYPEIFIPRGGILLVDLSFGAAATVRFSLRGVKLYGPCQ